MLKEVPKVEQKIKEEDDVLVKIDSYAGQQVGQNDHMGLNCSMGHIVALCIEVKYLFESNSYLLGWVEINSYLFMIVEV